MNAKKGNYFCPYCGCDGVVYLGLDNGFFDAFEMVKMQLRHVHEGGRRAD